jgi:phosphatidylserine decarboxylase
MLRRSTPVFFLKNYKHLPKTHKLRRWWWVRKTAHFALFCGGCVAASYARAAYFASGTDDDTVVASFFLVSVMEALPLNIAARTCGYLAGQSLIDPVYHQRFLSLYTWWYGISLADVEQCPSGTVEDFETVQQFFERSIRKEVRPVDGAATLVVPCDATLTRLEFLPHEGGTGQRTRPELTVKGSRFSLRHFFRFQLPDVPAGHRRLLMTFHLGPQDSHRVYAPTAMRPSSTVYVPGTLFSVSDAMLRWVPTLLLSNERVCIEGKAHSSDRLVAIGLVGAMMHGSIVIPFDERITTNPEIPPSYAVHLKYSKPPLLSVMQEVGRFRWGSAVVLVTDVRDNERVSVQVGQHLLAGQALITEVAEEKNSMN